MINDDVFKFFMWSCKIYIRAACWLVLVCNSNFCSLTTCKNFVVCARFLRKLWVQKGKGKNELYNLLFWSQLKIAKAVSRDLKVGKYLIR